MNAGAGGAGKVPVDVDGRQLALSHLDKVWYPETGTTKGECLHYYAAVAAVMVPHLRRRAASFVRAPDGVDGDRFVAKHVPPGAPEWLPTVTVVGRDGPREQIAVDDTATLMWAANAAAIEFHVPQWRDGGADRHDRLVLDLDPGPGTDLVDCCRLALLLRDELARDGLPGAVPVVSGAKGLHLYAPLDGPDAPSSEEGSVAYARELAERMAEADPDGVTAVMAKAQRDGRIFIDWSQNRAAKTTCAPYSLRARPTPSVCTPVTWDEVSACTTPTDLRFPPSAVLARLTTLGDLLTV